MSFMSAREELPHMFIAQAPCTMILPPFVPGGDEKHDDAFVIKTVTLPEQREAFASDNLCIYVNGHLEFSWNIGDLLARSGELPPALVDVHASLQAISKGLADGWEDAYGPRLGPNAPEEDARLDKLRGRLTAATLATAGLLGEFAKAAVVFAGSRGLTLERSILVPPRSELRIETAHHQSQLPVCLGGLRTRQLY